MPIPVLNDHGLLPEGLHLCSLDELQERFGQFQISARRPTLFRKFTELVHEIRATGLVTWLVVDGSFVTAKPEPEDVDLILVLSETHNFAAELRPFEYNVLSRKRVRRRYNFDVLIAREHSVELQEYLAFFQQVRGETEFRKGLLKVLP